MARALFIGRFQPFHRGHLHLLHHIRDAFHEVVVGVGSSQYSHTRRNPFSFAERHEMVHRALEAEGLEGCTVVAIPDVGDDDRWVDHVLSLVPPFDAVFSHDPLTRRLFREAAVPVRNGPLLDRERFSGTEIRRRMRAGGAWRELVPAPVAAYLETIDGVGRVRETVSREGEEEQE